MKIKTFKSQSLEEIDNLCNTFEETHNVKATQTHVNIIDDNPIIYIYTYVLFYEPKQNIEIQQQQLKQLKDIKQNMDIKFE